MQSPGAAFIFVANLAPPFDSFQFYFVGNPTVWVGNSDIFTYINAPTITSVRPNYVRCTRTPILITPGSNLTHTCSSSQIDVNGCGYEESKTKASYCSFLGSTTLSGNRIQNAPFTPAQVASNQQLKCMIPEGTVFLQKSCPQFQNASLIMGSRNFSITQVDDSVIPVVVKCELSTQKQFWFPLQLDTQVKFTFYDNPAYVDLTITSAFVPANLESSDSLPLKFIRVSNQFSFLSVFCSIFPFMLLGPYCINHTD